jgi:DNA polymerase III subunit alpha
VFQFESEGMREALKKVRPTEFEDLVALVALYRPGAMDQIPTYARGKRDPQTVAFPDERLRSITEPTKGVILYQEQSMQIAKEIAGFSGAKADDLRKAIGKKNRAAMASLKPEFFEGCRKSETSAAVTEALWTTNERSADYSFNKSHAACYALISYRTAWLKANYPAEYMAGLISSVMQTKDKVPYYVSRCEEMGIDVLPPDVNESGHDFVVVRGADASAVGDIRFGLDAVKHVGAGAVDAIIAARKADGPFRSIWDFCRRVSSRTVNKKAIESLVKCGALDSTGAKRTGMLKVLEQAQAGGAKAQEDEQLGQGSIFDLAQPRTGGGEQDGGADAGPALGREDPPVPLLEDERDAVGAMEKETLGLFLSSHPVKAVRPALRAETDCSLAMLSEHRDGESVMVGGVVTALKRMKTKKGEPMAFATLDDLEGQAEMIVLGKTYAAAEELLGGDGVLLVKARLDHKEKDQTKLVAQTIEAFDPSPEEVARAAAEAVASPEAKRLTVLVAPEVADSFLDELGDVVRNFPGDHELMLRVGERNLVLGPDYRVAGSNACRAELDALPGVFELVA